MSDFATRWTETYGAAPPLPHALRAAHVGGWFRVHSLPGSKRYAETDEEAVVAKTARVTEEVVISKDVTERTERVSDTVRRTEVDVENTTGTERAVNRDVKVDRDLKADRDRDI